MFERLLHELASNGIPVDNITGTRQNLTVKYMDGATTKNKSDGKAIVDSFDWSQGAEDAWRAQRKREKMRQEVIGDESKTMRIMLSLLIKEINILRSRMVPALPPRTMTQIRNSIMQSINDGEAD